MCGIVGAVAKRPVCPILLEGLKQLEYRGYDSAGVAIIDNDRLVIHKSQGKVVNLCDAIQTNPPQGNIGIAHTRWATHGDPCQRNAHPHQSHDHVAIVHNGIIENYQALKTQLQQAGYLFDSDTDSEVIAHLLHQIAQTTDNTISQLHQLSEQLQGAFALGILFTEQPNSLFAIRKGSPLIIGSGIDENFIASDPTALLPVTPNHIILEEGDIAHITTSDILIYDQQNVTVDRKVFKSNEQASSVNKGHYRHFMLKEIYEQAETTTATLSKHLEDEQSLLRAFGPLASPTLSNTQRIHLVACGTSYHAALTAAHWIESIAHIPCRVDIASEYRYNPIIVEPGTLFVAFSQSGETADTLAALSQAKQHDYLATLAICNKTTSSLVRETDLHFLTQSGTEIGVAATKTFTTQLIAGKLLAFALASHQSAPLKQFTMLNELPAMINTLLELDPVIIGVAKKLAETSNALFIGRGALYPIAMEGSLKLKEISYIHAEAYAAGELKHGALALIDEQMPVIVCAPSNVLFDKLSANIEEVRARGGHVIVLTDAVDHFKPSGITTIAMPTLEPLLQPLLYTIPLQLLAYHVAVLKGTDVDQPRNLAKSVTVE